MVIETTSAKETFEAGIQAGTVRTSGTDILLKR